ncbi:hypothetical protein [Photobacterium sp. OFAV2-7]|uniref:hypothetical protein n=1 Tax=Photobacterium sp. OFAV2-7 TaxID=2917748 RepID=UPI001EF602DE|nr:hypothetical protein [Photobacterium sp. OFAV2-7]MCG7585422.1 hypothetical protein [Photobacterium sp. OFAV2-7]
MYNKKAVCTAIAAILLGGCNSSDSSSTPTPTPPPSKIKGTAATGAPIYGEITVLESNGDITKLDANKSGQFELDYAQTQAPALLYATGASGDKSVDVYSMLIEGNKQSGVVNVTPLTQLLISRMTGVDAKVAFADFATYKHSLTIDKAREAQDEIKQVLSVLLEAANVSSDFDLLSSAFETNNQNIDAVLDLIQVEFGATSATMTYRANTDYSVTLSYDENWNNKTLLPSDMTVEKAKDDLSIITSADRLLEGMTVANTQQTYNTFIHDDAHWFGVDKSGMFAQKEKILPNENAAMDRFKNFSLVSIDAQGRALVSYSERYEDSPFASGGRNRAWFRKDSNGEYKFLGRTDDLPFNITTMLKLSYYNQTMSWAVEIDAFADVSVCEKVTESNYSWFEGTPKLADLSAHTSATKIVFDGPGLEKPVEIDKIYKQVSRDDATKITGCHLASSKMPGTSLIIHGVPVKDGVTVGDNSAYTVTYYNGTTKLTEETVNISKGMSTKAEMQPYLAKQEALVTDEGNFYVRWSRESTLVTDLDLWVFEEGNAGSTRVSINEGEQEASSKTLKQVNSVSLAAIDHYGRAIGQALSY